MSKTFYIFIFCLLSVLKIEGQITNYAYKAEFFVDIGGRLSDNVGPSLTFPMCEMDSTFPIQIVRNYEPSVPAPIIDSVEIYFTNIVTIPNATIPNSIIPNFNTVDETCQYIYSHLINSYLIKKVTIYPQFTFRSNIIFNNSNRILDTSQTISLSISSYGIIRPALMDIYAKFYGPFISSSFQGNGTDSLYHINAHCGWNGTLYFRECPNLIANFQNDTICLNDSLQIQNLSNTEGNSYKWLFPNANITEAYGFTPPPIKYTTPGVYPVTLIGGDGVCNSSTHPYYFCIPRGSSDTITKNIVVLSAPSFNFGFTDTSLCVGDSLFLDAAVNDASITYTWSNGKNTPQIWVKEEEFIKVTLENQVPCAAQDSIFITWNTAPTINLSVPKTTICDGQMIEITAAALLQQQLIWNTGENTFSIAVQDSGWYWAEVNNDCGLDRDSLFINVIPDIDTVALPNIITPNADGINDEYTFAAMNDLESYDIFVYNRWGNLVFTGNKQTAPWQGNTNTGENLADGVYFVLFNYKNCEQELISLKKAVYVMR